MNFQKDLVDYQNLCDQKTEAELRQLRRSLIKALRVLDEKLGLTPEKAGSNKVRCPHCRSNSTKGHGRNPVKRFYCLDCNQTFPESKSSLYYRKRYHDKILDLIVTIHTTNKSVSQIVQEFNISVKTYYKWKKDILNVFPQLEEKFKRKRGKK